MSCECDHYKATLFYWAQALIHESIGMPGFECDEAEEKAPWRVNEAIRDGIDKFSLKPSNEDKLLKLTDVPNLHLLSEGLTEIMIDELRDCMCR